MLVGILVQGWGNFLCLTADKSADDSSPDTDSPATMAKHYRTLQILCKKKNPNHESVSQLLDLEFAARRAFIDSDTVREEDRHKKILEVYPCFNDIGHVSHYWLAIIQNLVPVQCFIYFTSS